MQWDKLPARVAAVSTMPTSVAAFLTSFVFTAFVFTAFVLAALVASTVATITTMTTARDLKLSLR